MRLLFLAGGSPATVFALSPLATAARNAGHEIVMASTEEMMPFIAGVGIPCVPVTEQDMRQFMFADRNGSPLAVPEDPAERLFFNGRGFGRMAAASLDALMTLVEDWRPELVVGGSLCFAAPLVASRSGVPWVRHTWDLGEPAEIDVGAAAELAPELEALGLDGIAAPDLWVDICPPSLRPPSKPDGGPRQSMRFIPYNQQRRLEPWMYTRGQAPRVCVTAGSRVTRDAYLDYLEDLVGKIAALDAEVVVAAPDDVAADIRAKTPFVRSGWVPLDTLLFTCDLLVHHAGGQSCLTALNAGVPQLLIPNIPKMVPPCRRLSDYGAASMLLPGDDSPENVAEAGRKLLSEPGHRERAMALRHEMATMPPPAEVVGVLEKLTVGS